MRSHSPEGRRAHKCSFVYKGTTVTVWPLQRAEEPAQVYSGRAGCKTSFKFVSVSLQMISTLRTKFHPVRSAHAAQQSGILGSALYVQKHVNFCRIIEPGLLEACHLHIHAQHALKQPLPVQQNTEDCFISRRAGT